MQYVSGFTPKAPKLFLKPLLMNALSHTTGYAIVALSFVGCSDKPWVQAHEIAQRTGIPKPYLSKILHELGHAGVIHTKRGAGGGVALSRPAGSVTLWEVAQAVEPIEAEPRCFLGMAACSEENPCPMHPFWTEMRKQTHQQLAQTTLAQVAKYQSSMGFKAAAIEELLSDLPPGAKIYRGKPTALFLRKFGVLK